MEDALNHVHYQLIVQQALIVTVNSAFKDYVMLLMPLLAHQILGAPARYVLKSAVVVPMLAVHLVLLVQDKGSVFQHAIPIIAHLAVFVQHLDCANKHVPVVNHAAVALLV
jgi:hypothetical protein